MKKSAFYMLLLLGLSAALSCRKNEERPGFTLNYQEDLLIPAGIGSFDVHYFYLPNIPTRYVEALAQHGKADADIVRILATTATLNGVFGDANFNFINEVSLRVYDEANPSNKVEIAYRLPVPLEPGNTLPLIPNDTDFKRLMTGSRFGLELVLWLRNTTQMDTDVRLELQVKAEYR
jgi:hypothetical protein